MAEDGGDQAAEDRTEAPTPRRLEKARDEGQVALSREVVALGALGGGALAVAVAMPMMLEPALHGLRGVLTRAHGLAAGDAVAAMMRIGLLVVLPVALSAAAGAAVATLLQTRGLITAKLLRPQLSRLSPLAGLKRLLGAEAAVELLRTLLKLSLVGAALFWTVGDPGSLQAALHLSAGGLLQRIADVGLRLAAMALAAFALVALLDLLWVRFRHSRRLRMSRQDLREELKETEGDPQVKGRRRQIRLQRARQRMLAAVPRAAVVVTNPTHFAVALAYEQGTSTAPKVVAKGVDSVAARIRQVAEQHRVPIVANPPLARALFRIELDAEIPPEHYQAVAEIIAYVLRLRARVPL